MRGAQNDCREDRSCWAMESRFDAVEAANEFVDEYSDVMCRLASGEKGAGMKKIEVEFTNAEWAVLESWMDAHRDALAERWGAETPEQIVHLLVMHGMDEGEALHRPE